ncbi:MAG: Na(+)/H(+) antiporter subunit D, partial [Gammaproteobacteria bacterium]|nr:Na(+)/H(+) antiporter subunit D [Gammaproteobacteria bacterium]
MLDASPALPLFLGALLTLFVRGHLRAAVMLAAPLLGAYGVYQLEPGTTTQVVMLGYSLTPVRVDGLAILFAYLFHLAAFIGVLFALHLRDRLQDTTALAYAGSAVGAVFAGDLLTLFIYWELLALTSAGLIFARRNERALAAGIRYLVVQIGSGVLLLAGVILYAQAGQGLAFDHIGLDAPGGWLIFIAFGIKSAFPMLHGWLTDAYPEATATGTVFL